MTAITLYGSSLTQPERDKHRAFIGVRVEALLDGYWQNRPSDIVKAEIIMDWMDALEAFTPDEIRNACRDWLKNNPRRKPNTGDIRGLILADRQAVVRAVPQIEETPKERVTAEAAAAIMEQAGFAPKRIA